MPTPPVRFPEKPHLITVSTWTIVKVVLILIGLALLWLLKDVVAILFMALLLAALIDPFADWFAKRKIPRGISVLIVYAILLGIAALALILVIPPVVSQVQQLIGNFAQTYEAAVRSFSQFQAVSIEYGFGENFQSSLQALQQGVGKSVSEIFSTITGFFGGMAAFVVVLVLAFYMVVEEDAARRFFKNLAPEEYQPFLGTMFNKMQKRIGSWLRGQLVLGIVIGSAVYIGLLILGVPYALVLGLIAGLLEIVPYAGPMLSSIPILIIAFSVSPLKGVMALVLIIAIQQIENNVLVPKVMQKATGLNPIVSIIALLVGIKLGGLVGAILAIPVATMVAVAAEELFAAYPSAGERGS
jgi:predicted PurR-regulated permease PerM